MSTREKFPNNSAEMKTIDIERSISVNKDTVEKIILKYLLG